LGNLVEHKFRMKPDFNLYNAVVIIQLVHLCHGNESQIALFLNHHVHVSIFYYAIL